MRTYTHGVIGYLLYAKRPRHEQRLAIIGSILPDVFLALGFVAHYGAIVTPWFWACPVAVEVRFQEPEPLINPARDVGVERRTARILDLRSVRNVRPAAPWRRARSAPPAPAHGRRYP